ncbi:MAG: hypothetical protein AAB784_00670 [Patescibacteria group bacterium]
MATIVISISELADKLKEILTKDSYPGQGLTTEYLRSKGLTCSTDDICKAINLLIEGGTVSVRKISYSSNDLWLHLLVERERMMSLVILDSESKTN